MPKKSLNKAKRILAGATLAGSLLLTSGAEKLKNLEEKPPELRLPYGLVTSQELRMLLKKMLTQTVPETSRVLTQEEESTLSELISKTLGIKAVSELNGNRLNHQMGYIGLEQHLPRRANDTLAGRNFPQVGLTSSRGAWGYVPADKEKYYLAVQTLYLPEWRTRLGELKDWYKFRKMLAINPETGAAVVAVIADAGPAKWTGKQFGGSPQVMHDLGFYPTKTKGKILLLFIDDPDDKIPLGPLNHAPTI